MVELTTVKVGYHVAMIVKPDAAPLKCYVGEVQAVDERGVRLTLVDWLIDEAVGYDMFAPWESITSMLICTPEHDLSHFGDHAAKWQDRMMGR